MSVQQCLIKISSVQAWDVGMYSLGKKRAKHWFQRSSVVQVSIFDHTSDEIVFIELTLGYVCVCPREPGRSQIHKMGDDVKKCYYWRLSPGVARHLNVIEKESLPSHRFFFWLKRKKVDVSENAKKPIISAVLLLHLIKMSLVLLIERV